VTAPLLAAATPRAVWYLTRGAGAVTLVGLTATVTLGVLDVSRWRSRRWPRFVLDAVHRDVALITLAVLALHVLTAVVDSFAPIRLIDAVVPFVSPYRPLWLGLGALALDVLLAVAITSGLRRRLGHRAWRAVHWAAYACWPLALVHGLGTGSDVQVTWLTALSAACVLAVLTAAVWRVGAAERPRPGTKLAAIGALAGACLALAAWALQGPLAPGWARRAGTPAALLPRAAAARARAGSGAPAMAGAGPTTSATVRAGSGAPVAARRVAGTVVAG
jgi:hypothetical protein